MIKGVEHIVRQAAEQIDYEPTSQIVHPDYFGVGNDLPPGPHERRVEIKHNVYEKYDVHY